MLKHHFTPLLTAIAICAWTHSVKAQPVGINTTAPASQLDLNGDMRIRGGSPQALRLLTATNNTGSAAWAAAPANAAAVPNVSFRVERSAAGGASNIPGNGTWYRIPFSEMVYNNGNHYTGWTNQPGYNIFKAPVKGIYHFDVQSCWSNHNSGFTATFLRIIVRRNNTNTAARIYDQNQDNGKEMDIFNVLTADLMLEANDEVWVEAAHFSPNQSARQLSNLQFNYFSGRLMFRL